MDGTLFRNLIRAGVCLILGLTLIASAQTPPALELFMVPAIRVQGEPGEEITLEVSDSVDGPWAEWKTVAIQEGDNVLVDLDAAQNARFYRIAPEDVSETPESVVIPDLELELLPIPAGTFTMGSPTGQSGRDLDEGPQTEVTISEPFWLGETEVTISQFRRFLMDGGSDQGN